MLKSNLIRSIEFGTAVARRQVLHGYYTYYSYYGYYSYYTYYSYYGYYGYYTC